MLLIINVSLSLLFSHVFDNYKVFFYNFGWWVLFFIELVNIYMQLLFIQNISLFLISGSNPPANRNYLITND